MSANYQLRPVLPQDAQDLQAVCWPERSIEAVRELLERVDGLANRKRAMGVVAYNDLGLLGYGQLTVWPRTTEISDLIVAPNSRNSGIGTAIIEYLIEQVRSLRMSEVEIGVALNNPRALALYQRLGFAEDRIITLDLGQGPEPVMYLTMRLNTPGDSNPLFTTVT
jgi:ribosomal protein S18 acetylase RimI-like enzyme